MIGGAYYRIKEVENKYETGTHNTTISLKKELITNLKLLADRMGISRSELIRHCIYQALPIIEKKQRVLENPNSKELIIDGKEIQIIGEA